jgi:hypothetical protein
MRFQRLRLHVARHDLERGPPIAQRRPSLEYLVDGRNQPVAGERIQAQHRKHSLQAPAVPKKVDRRDHHEPYRDCFYGVTRERRERLRLRLGIGPA